MLQDGSIASESLVLNRLLTRNARYRPNHLALVVGELRLTWAELDAQVNRWANALMGLGVRRGDRVATLLAELRRTGVDISRLLQARRRRSAAFSSTPCRRIAILAGRCVAPSGVKQYGLLSCAWSRSLLTLIPKPIWALIDAERPGFRCLSDLAASMDAVDPGVTVRSDDLATIMYTSGTTGLPKGIQHTHFIRAMYASLFSTNFRMAPESVALHTGAMVFNGAMLTFLPALYCGATFILQRQFNAADAVSAIEAYGVTHTMLVPVADCRLARHGRLRIRTLALAANVGVGWCATAPRAQGPTEQYIAGALL